MALVKTNVDLPDIFRQDRSIHTIYNDENESIQRVMVTIQLDSYYFTIITALVPTLNIPDAGSAEQRVVPLVYLPKYGGVKKLEYVRLSKLNIYVLNSPLQHHTSDDMSVAVKLSMVPNPLVKSSCSYHTNGPDDVPIIEGCPASTDPEPAHTDSVLTSTETPIDDEKAPVQSKLEILITPTMETWNLQNSIQLFVSKFYVFFNNVVIHILLLSTKVFLSTYLWYSAI
ncbi:hypothetical protein IGI04_030248 [Brassica rapa subsp. trilocularis]|uniref:Uncharacterized protein n=1 Tax=Brassica rapa subsp. trilocularis TaxID=1813537 RepID=A0ABQ7LQZ9_BRACM|nr:hypothetical protein IGI04_030248 [Brassica rapa subsp. trilocularis]